MTPEQQRELAAALPERPAQPKASVPAQLVSLARTQFSFIRGLDGQCC